MKHVKFLLAIVILLTMTSGCVLFRPEPTPIAWLPTYTPSPTVSAEVVEETPTPTPASNTATPSAKTPTATQQATEQIITVVTPLPEATVSNPLRIAGNVAVTPFEGTLLVRIYDVNGAIAAEMPITVQGDLGNPGTFENQIVYGGNPGPGRLEILDISAEDGSIIAKAEVSLQLGGFPGSGVINQPQTQEKVTLPIRLLAHAGNPGQQVNIALIWADGFQISQNIEAIPAADGTGLIITVLDMPPHIANHPPTQTAEISITSIDGSPLALQPITLLAPGSADTMTTQVFWVKGNSVVAETINIPRTLGIARASLTYLIWGPPPDNAMGYTSALPTPLEIYGHPSRTPAWGETIRINNLAINDGVATVDFSPELLAHGGGTTQIELIKRQIEATLLQFSTVDSVVITVEGQADALQP